VASGKCTTESALAVETLPSKLQTRRDEHFIPRMVKKPLTYVVQDGEITMKRNFRISKEFYYTILSHLEAWKMRIY
jgi:hypothetical protein